MLWGTSVTSVCLCLTHLTDDEKEPLKVYYLYTKTQKEFVGQLTTVAFVMTHNNTKR